MKETYQHSSTYYCNKCKMSHKSGSKIGIEHLEFINRKLTDEERKRLIKYRKEKIK